jgi:L-ascorbate oxidase
MIYAFIPVLNFTLIPPFHSLSTSCCTKLPFLSLFFYHAHQSMMDSDGASGMIVINPNSSSTQPPDYDEVRQVFLKDWWHTTSDQQVVGLMSNPFKFVGSPDALLFNGKAIWFQCLPGGAYFNNSDYCLSTCTNYTSSLDTINVTMGKTYRLRMINAAALVVMNVAITNHNITIIEVDGTIVDPISVTSIDLSPGQRFSVLLTADQDPADYWLRVTVRFRNYPNITGMAIVRYIDANSTLPSITENLPPNVMWNDSTYGQNQEASLSSKEPNSYSESLALSENVDIRRLILVSTQAKDPISGNTLWAINNISSTTVTTVSEPIIVTAYTAAKLKGWPVPVEGTVDLPEEPPVPFNYSSPVWEGPGPNVGSQGNLVLRLKKGDVVELVFQNTLALNNVSELHSWHIHGHSAWVVGQGTGIYDSSRDVENYNLKNPVLQDTFDMYPFGWTAVRFVASNPGAWLFHCHLSSHIIMGMDFTLLIQPDEIDSPPEGAYSCTENSLTPAPSPSPTSGNFTTASPTTSPTLVNVTIAPLISSAAPTSLNITIISSEVPTTMEPSMSPTTTMKPSNSPSSAPMLSASGISTAPSVSTPPTEGRSSNLVSTSSASNDTRSSRIILALAYSFLSVLSSLIYFEL